MPTAEQIRGARGLLGWSAAELARRAHVSPTTIVRCERGSGIPRVRMETLESIQRTLEAAGVEFISGGNGPGVRLRRR
jgi:predicted transcriptional regulator